MPQLSGTDLETWRHKLTMVMYEWTHSIYITMVARESNNRTIQTTMETSRSKTAGAAEGKDLCFT